MMWIKSLLTKNKKYKSEYDLVNNFAIILLKKSLSNQSSFVIFN